MALPIFPGSHPPSIVGANELNFCVRDGNRWTLAAINTNYFFLRGFVPLDSYILTHGFPFVNNYFYFFQIILSIVWSPRSAV